MKISILKNEKSQIAIFIICFISIFILYNPNGVSLKQVFVNSKIFGLNPVNKLTELDDSELPWWERSSCGNITHGKNVINGKIYPKKSGSDQSITNISQPESLSATEAIHQGKEFDNDQYYSAYELWKRKEGRHNTCGWRSWKEGFGQKVLSFSIYGSNPSYWRSINVLLNSIKKLYPGWVVRIYMDPRGRKRDFCPILAEHPNLHLCDVKANPVFGDITSVHPMLWRAAPLADPYVDLLAVRDSDAVILQREVDAVSEWIRSGKVLHIMRDHPWHGVYILGGMWGVNMKAADRKTLMDITQKTLTEGTSSVKHGYDQFVLKRTLYSTLKKSMISHDSYLCHMFKGSRPWPTQRQKHTFVGNKSYINKFAHQEYIKECPIQCRPKDHHDWLYC